MKRQIDMTVMLPRNGTIFEAKFAVPREMRNMVLSILGRRASVPKRFATARLRTLYFDDALKTSYFESRDGQLFKRKYRLREYIDPEPAGAFYSIEVKKRSNNLTSKVKKLIYKRLPEGFRPATFRGLIEAFEELSGESMTTLRSELPDTGLFPTVAVHYERSRFDDPDRGARYNLDTNIMVFASNPLLESCDGIYLEHDIFEIKGPEPADFPPYLKSLSIEPFSFSKFVWGGERSFDGSGW